MAFPLTHLCAAWRVLEMHPMPKRDAAQFLLGSIAPDAIHYRKEFMGSEMSSIGAAKKITHLCPVSDEKWGQVTDNENWVNCVNAFLLKSSANPFAAGYAVHVLTDIHNNRTIWDDFRTNHPAEAAKDYASDYYKDLRNIDAHLYQDFPATAQIMVLLSSAVPKGLPGLVTADETHAIQQKISHEHFKNAVREENYSYLFVTYEDTLNFIQSSADFSANFLY